MLNAVKSRLISGKTLILFSFIFLISYQAYSQNITNTLGTDGEFKIKDASTTFLTLRQGDGLLSIHRNIWLEDVAGTEVGILYKGDKRFLHNFAPSDVNGYNTFLGLDAGNFTMSGTGTNSSYNTGIGYSSLYSNTTGSYNTALGFKSLYTNTTGVDNTALGYASLFYNTTGSSNTAMGDESLSSNTTGSYNAALGDESLSSNTTGFSNTAVGFRSLYKNTTGYRNTAIGDSSLYSNTTGYGNTAMGYYSLWYNTIGRYNIAIGYGSLWSNTEGSFNTAMGDGSLESNTDGSYNTAVGYDALSNTTGNNNTAMGYMSLYLNTTGVYNTALGYGAGYQIMTGNNNTLIGYDSDPSSGTVNNEITLGDNNITALRCNVQTITSLSDARDKKNINYLSLGLDFITKLKPRQFNWDRREWYEDNKSDGSKMEEELTAGFIAQELDKVQQSENAEWLELVYKSNPEKLEATTGNLLPVMVKAIQELNDKNESLEIEIVKLKSEIESLKSVNEKLVKLEKLIMEMKSNDNKIKEIKSSSN